MWMILMYNGRIFIIVTTKVVFDPNSNQILKLCLTLSTETSFLEKSISFLFFMMSSFSHMEIFFNHNKKEGWEL